MALLCWCKDVHPAALCGIAGWGERPCGCQIARLCAQCAEGAVAQVWLWVWVWVWLLVSVVTVACSLHATARLLQQIICGLIVCRVLNFQGDGYSTGVCNLSCWLWVLC
jgi:hypothetical protein